jgi:D-cysteine desulfhydrase
MIPLFARYPALSALPRVSLGTFPTPVARIASISPNLWVKRDDLCADPLGGNKTRALEFLLGGVRAGDSIVTVGSAGSTHAFAVATYGKQLGARVLVGRWKQEMNDTARRVADGVARTADDAPIFGSPAGAYLWAASRHVRGAKWIAAGGSTPVGILGHVNAGLELVEQIERGEVAAPAFVVVPLGTGGTAAGLALAFAIARRPITVVGARVVPWIVGRAARVHRLAAATAKLIERLSKERVSRPSRESIVVAHETYGGAYGRETPVARAAAARLHGAAAVTVDATYSAKALGKAIELAAEAPTLFWLTFDERSAMSDER